MAQEMALKCARLAFFIQTPFLYFLGVCVCEGVQPSYPMCMRYFMFAVDAKEPEEEPSSQAKGVWDSVVSWMKMAVDFIALDSTSESLPSAVPHGRVCML